MVYINPANVAAIIHADMCNDERNGYDQITRWGGDHPDGLKTIEIDGLPYTYKLGSRDCSSSVCEAWRLALTYTPFAGVLNGATYTGNMRSVFLNSGLFWADRSPARRGDVYLNDANHTAMCQDGGSDGVYNYDAMSQFSINEWGGITGGQVGDQTGWESSIGAFSEYPWDTTLHYNGEANCEVDDGKIIPDPEPERGRRCNRDGNKLELDGIGGSLTIGDWQADLGFEKPDEVISSQWRGNIPYFNGITAVEFADPAEGSKLVKKVQTIIGVDPDGIWGGDTSEGLQIWLINHGFSVGKSGADRIFGHDSVVGLQESINAGVWKGL